MPYTVKSASAVDQKLKVQSLADHYIMIDMKGISLDPIDTIIDLEVIK